MRPTPQPHEEGDLMYGSPRNMPVVLRSVLLRPTRTRAGFATYEVYTYVRQAKLIRLSILRPSTILIAPRKPFTRKSNVLGIILRRAHIHVLMMQEQLRTQASLIVERPVPPTLTVRDDAGGSDGCRASAPQVFHASRAAGFSASEVVASVPSTAAGTWSKP